MNNSLAIQDSKIAEIKKSGTSFDKIHAWYLYGSDKIILSHKDQEIRDRWEAAFSLLVNYHSTENAIPVLKTKYEISRAQAYRDIINAKRLFGDITQSSKEADRYILFELSMKTFQLAAKQSPPHIEGMNRAIANMIKLKGLDRDEPDAVRPEDLESHNYYMIVTYNGSPIKLDLNQMDKVPLANKRKFASMLENEIEDVDAVEIMKS